MSDQCWGVGVDKDDAEGGLGGGQCNNIRRIKRAIILRLIRLDWAWCFNRATPADGSKSIVVVVTNLAMAELE